MQMDLLTVLSTFISRRCPCRIRRLRTGRCQIRLPVPGLHRSQQRSVSVYQTEKIREISEYEHVEVFSGSERESGQGYSDICIEEEASGIGILLEIKYAEDGDLEKAAQKALDQIDEKE